MPITTTPKIWMNGALVDWADAQVHVLTHTLHYGTGVFEGIRAYETDKAQLFFVSPRTSSACTTAPKSWACRCRTRLKN